MTGIAVRSPNAAFAFWWCLVNSKVGPVHLLGGESSYHEQTQNSPKGKKKSLIVCQAKANLCSS